MTRTVIDLEAMRRRRPSGQAPQQPVLDSCTAAGTVLVPPEIHDLIGSGAYVDSLLGELAGTVGPGDRVLLIGAGLGIASTLAARAACDGRVIVAEPNALLVSHIETVHALNDIANAETVNALLAVGKRGYVEFCPDSDPRTPPRTGWQPPHRALMVPFMDLNVILAEARINVILCDTPVAPAALLAQADLAGVERILVHRGSDAAQCWGSNGICMLLAGLGFDAAPSGAAIRFCRPAQSQSSGLARIG
jgi:FkbM family methyltransferase